MSMLEDVRHSGDKGGVKKYVAAVLFGIIILVFVFMGTSDPQQAGPGYAARVNDQIISVREYQASVEQMVQYYAQMFGGEFDAEAQKRMRIKSAALDQLIARSAIVQAAGNSGFGVSPQEIRDVIWAIPAFQKDGQFRREFYDNFLTNRRLSAAQFEDDLKRELIFGKVRESFLSGMTPSPLEIEKIQRLATYKYNIEFIKFDAASLEKSITGNSEDARRFLATPEGLKNATDVFNANKASFGKDEQIRARHILITVDPAKPESAQQALDKISKAQAQLKTKSFDAVAKDLSEDQGSKAKGGDLGVFGRGRMVKEFEDAAFNQAVGVVGEPIKTPYGYHIIKVESKIPRVEPDFNASKAEIAQTLVGRQKRDRFVGQVREALEKGALSDVNKLTSQVGLKWEETGNFSVVDGAIPKMGEIDEVYAALPQLSAESSLYKGLITSGTDQYAFRLKSKTIVAEKAAIAKVPSPEVELRQRLASTRVRDAFGKWNDGLMKSSKIERNAVLLEGEANQ